MQQTEEKQVMRIGFYGAYSYDIILYLARSLSLFGKQVLVIDRSTDQEVVRTIRSLNPGDLQLGIFRFCGIDVTSRIIFPEAMKPEEVYDVILYDFGSNMCPEEYHACEVICYVLDMYVHNALRIQEAEVPVDSQVWMVLRDLFRGKAMARYHMRLTGKIIEKDDVFTIRLNSDDFVARFRMETDQLPRVELAGEEMQQMIRMMTSRICPDLMERKGKKPGRKKTTAKLFSA